MEHENTAPWLSFPQRLKTAPAEAMRRFLARGEEGFLLPAVIVLLTVGMLVLGPWLGLIATSINRTTEDTIEEADYYAADAGLEAAITILAGSIDPSAPGYSPPVLSVNGIDIALTFALAEDPGARDMGAILIDPGSQGPLASVAPDGAARFTIDGVRPLTPMQVNWARTASGPWRVTVTRHSVVVHTAEGSSSIANVIVPGDRVEGGAYALEFANLGETDATTLPYNGSGDRGGTWIKTTAFRAFAVTSAAGDATIKALVRQSPGPDPSRSSVLVASWRVE